MYKRVLVALDGSERSGAAVAQAESVTDKVDGEITVVHVREMASSRVSGPVHLDEAARDRVVHEGAETLRAHGYTVREQTHATYKRPSSVILQVAKLSNADLIVTGPDRHHSLIGAAVGSTPHALLHRAACPVLVAADRQRKTTSVPIAA